MTRARARTVVVAVVLVVAACGDDGDEAGPVRSTTDATSTTVTTEPDPTTSLPPPTALELEPIYGDQLAELGLRLTDRGGLIDRTGGGYVASTDGTHLALYVEPIGDRTVAEYIDGIRSVAAVFGDVFDRWPGLVSYDVCQEPTGQDGGEEDEPLPVTQIELTREEAAAFDWETVSVVDLVRASRTEPPGLALRVSGSLVRDPAYVAILEEAS